MLSLQKKINILFIGHEGSLSGAPVLLLNLLLMLKKQPQISFSLVLGRGGPIADKCSEHFDVMILKPDGYAQEGSIIGRIKGILQNRAKLFKLKKMAQHADLIFSNTIVNGKLLKMLASAGKPVITYVHELENVIRLFVPSGITADTIEYSSAIAYPSLRVKEALQKECKVKDDRLHRLSYYFPVDRSLVENSSAKETFVQQFREKYGLKGKVVGGMGLASDRKGTDLFISVCEKVVKVNKEIKFCWIGGFENKETEDKLRGMIKEKQLEDAIVFTGPLPHNYYNPAVFDIFFLSSREDPYPLVVLEAGFMKVPSICFEGSGGITEFVGDDAGWIIPGFDLDKAADAILHVQDQEQKGARAYEKSMSWHADEKVILDQLEEIIRKISS